LNIATLDYLHELDFRTEYQPVVVVLPCARADWPLFCLDVDESSRDPANQCTYSLRDQRRCLLHAKKILSILLFTFAEAVLSYKTTSAFQDFVSWIFDSLISVNRLEKKWNASPVIGHHPSIGWSFSALKGILSSLRDSASPSILRKGYISLSVLCVELLEHPEELSDTVLQFNLNSGILNLASMCKQFDSVERTVSTHMLPLLQDVLSNDDTRILLGKDFQVGDSIQSFKRVLTMNRGLVLC
jgi:serine/threonine-protein kinase ATR